MCLFPSTIKGVDAFGVQVVMSVPCGKCIECLKDRQNSWKIRLVEESREHLYTYFFTLTYNEDSVPFTYLEDGTKLLHVNKVDIQLWIKRNRMRFERQFNRKVDFKYFICSEHGPNTGRPHYHGLLFTEISKTFITSMFNDWNSQYGFTNFSLVGSDGKKQTSRSSLSSVGNYVAKYCVKPKSLRTQAERDINKHCEAGRIPFPFYLMSKGLGASYVDRMKRWHVPRIRDKRLRITTVVDRMHYHDGSFKFKLPRYFKDRLYRKKYPCETYVYNKKLKCCEKKIVQRYKSKNMLSLQIQTEIRNRVLEDYRRRFAELKSACPGLSDLEIDIRLARLEQADREARGNYTFTKLARFYNRNRFKNRNL